MVIALAVLTLSSCEKMKPGVAGGDKIADAKVGDDLRSPNLFSLSVTRTYCSRAGPRCYLPNK